MTAHHVESLLKQDGKLTLDSLPFHAGEAVERIRVLRPKGCTTTSHPLDGDTFAAVQKALSNSAGVAYASAEWIRCWLYSTSSQCLSCASASAKFRYSV